MGWRGTGAGGEETPWHPTRGWDLAVPPNPAPALLLSGSLGALGIATVVGPSPGHLAFHSGVWRQFPVSPGSSNVVQPRSCCGAFKAGLWPPRTEPRLLLSSGQV